MSEITIIEHDGTEHTVALDANKTLMQVAMEHGVPGIDADCGGECACGTCHVIVDEQWSGAVGEASDDEAMMLDMTPEKADSSRLACQVQLTEAMDGLVVRLPEFQM